MIRTLMCDYICKLKQMREFYQGWPIEIISQTASAKLKNADTVCIFQWKYFRVASPIALAALSLDEKQLVDEIKNTRRALRK